MADEPKTTPAPEQEGLDGDSAQVEDTTPQEELTTSGERADKEHETTVDSDETVHKENVLSEENQRELESEVTPEQSPVEVEESLADGSAITDEISASADQQTTPAPEEAGGEDAEGESDMEEAAAVPASEEAVEESSIEETDHAEESQVTGSAAADEGDAEEEKQEAAEQPAEAAAEDEQEEVAEQEEAAEDEQEEVAEQEEPAEQPAEAAAEDEQEEVAEEEQEEPAEQAEDNKQWYVVKVQSGREESIRDAIERRVKIEGLEDYFDQIVIPVEKETVMQKNKRVTRERKLFPGYIMAKVDFNDQILYLFRETSGVGDFVGGSLTQQPQPMSPTEVARMFGEKPETKEKKAGPKVESPYSEGDQVKVKDGVFSGMEGVVREVLPEKDQVRVEVFVLGRAVSVELEYWQVDPV